MKTGARSTALFDADGNPVWLTLVCTRCRHAKPFCEFGLRKMPDGKMRNISQCKRCRALPPVKRNAGGGT